MNRDFSFGKKNYWWCPGGFIVTRSLIQTESLEEVPSPPLGRWVTSYPCDVAVGGLMSRFSIDEVDIYWLRRILRAHTHIFLSTTLSPVFDFIQTGILFNSCLFGFLKAPCLCIVQSFFCMLRVFETVVVRDCQSCLYNNTGISVKILSRVILDSFGNLENIQELLGDRIWT